ncbi:MAG: helix-turn-helix domain-containing protein [Alphaproteobacteria bacterium]|nr:helix-turn-helix domain-containing protein [Alphaproteobacteria bacterium]
MTGTLTERRRGSPVGGDLRRRAVAAVLEKGMSARAAARLFEVSDVSVLRWVRRYRERGHLLDDPRPGRASVTEPERERIFRLMRERPDLSMRALHRALAAEGAVFSASALQRFLKRHGLQRGRRLAWRRKPAPPPAAGGATPIL